MDNDEIQWFLDNLLPTDAEILRAVNHGFEEVDKNDLRTAFFLAGKKVIADHFRLKYAIKEGFLMHDPDAHQMVETAEIIFKRAPWQKESTALQGGKIMELALYKSPINCEDAFQKAIGFCGNRLVHEHFLNAWKILVQHAGTINATVRYVLSYRSANGSHIASR